VFELVRKLFFASVIVFVEPAYPTQLFVAIIGSVVLSFIAAYIEPFADEGDHLNASMSDLIVLLVLIAALSIEANSYVNKDDTDVTVEYFLLTISIFPIFLALFLLVRETSCFINMSAMLEKRKRAHSHGLYGNVPYWKIYASTICCCKSRYPVKDPRIPLSLKAPLVAMSDIVKKVLANKERLSLLGLVAVWVRKFCELSHANGLVAWEQPLDKELALHVLVGSAGKSGTCCSTKKAMEGRSRSTSVDTLEGLEAAVPSPPTALRSEDVRKMAAAITDGMCLYMSSVDHAMDTAGKPEPFNRAHAKVQRLHQLLLVAHGKDRYTTFFGAPVTVDLNVTDEDEVTPRGIYQMQQRLKEACRMLRTLPAYKKAAKEARTDPSTLALLKKKQEEDQMDSLVTASNKSIDSVSDAALEKRHGGALDTVYLPTTKRSVIRPVTSPVTKSGDADKLFDL